MNTYLALSPDSPQSLPRGFTPAHMIYKSRGGKLYISRSARRIGGGAAVMSITELTLASQIDTLAADIVHEIDEYGYVAVALDIDGKVSSAAARFADVLAERIAPKPVFVPEEYGNITKYTRVLIQTALSGGYLSRHFSTAIELYGRSRVGAEIGRLMMDFTLPAYAGVGTALSKSQLRLLGESAMLFFSDALTVNYFLYGKATPHIVLFDDAESINAKLALADDFGIRDVFMYYPQVEEILGAIRPR